MFCFLINDIFTETGNKWKKRIMLQCIWFIVLSRCPLLFYFLSPCFIINFLPIHPHSNAHSSFPPHPPSAGTYVRSGGSLPRSRGIASGSRNFSAASILASDEPLDPRRSSSRRIRRLGSPIRPTVRQRALRGARRRNAVVHRLVSIHVQFVLRR